MPRLLLLALCLAASFGAQAGCRQEALGLVCTAAPGVTHTYSGASAWSSNAGMLSIAGSERRHVDEGLNYASGVDTDGNRWFRYHTRRKGSRFLLWSDAPRQQPEDAVDDASFHFAPASDCGLLQPTLEIHYGIAYSLACDAGDHN